MVLEFFLKILGRIKMVFGEIDPQHHKSRQSDEF